MDRRTFIRGAVPLVTVGFATAACSQSETTTAAPTPAAGSAQGALLTPAQAERIGMTTVCFRHNMVPPIGAPATSGPKFDLLGAPKFMKDTFGIKNVEVWNYQFTDSSLDFCQKLRAQAESIGSRIINLQLDADYDLSSTDPKRRADSLVVVKGWMDRAKALGAPSMRANIDAGRPNLPLVLGPATESFKQLAAYGREIGVKILVENHIGASAKVDNCVELIKAVNDPFCRAIIDWGNSSATTPEARVADLGKLFPYVELVSAKGLNFDTNYQTIEYPIAPIVAATEASGYHGVYSIELYSEPNPPADTVAACRSMIAGITPQLRS